MWADNATLLLFPTLDYPLPVSVREYCGIDIIFNYVNCIALEQNFLRFFPETYVREILKNYAAGVTERMVNEELYASDMIENILLSRKFSAIVTILYI